MLKAHGKGVGLFLEVVQDDMDKEMQTVLAASFLKAKSENARCKLLQSHNTRCACVVLPH